MNATKTTYKLERENIMRTNEAINEMSNDQLLKVADSIGATTPYSAVSDRYSFVLTIDAVNFLRDSGWLPVMASQCRVRLEDRQGFQKHMIRFTRPDLVVGDHRLDLLLYNSHDRGSAFRLVGGVFRFVCGNGLVIGDTMAEFSHKHVGFKPELFIDSARQLGAQLDKTANVVDAWKAIDLEETEKGVFALAAHQVIYDEPEAAPIRPDQLLTPRRYADRTENNLWTTFNTIQENTIRGGLYGRNKKGRRARTRAVTSIDKNKKLNQALWTLTEKMAELKAA